MKIFSNLVYRCAVVSMFIPGITSTMLQQKNNGAVQKNTTLEFLHNNQSIAKIPVSVAITLSKVFKTQCTGPMNKERFKIDVNEFDPKTIKLFTRMVNAPTTLANQLPISALQVKTPAELRTKLVNMHGDLVLDLYGFLATYDINEYIPLLAEQFLSAFASTSDLYNRAKFPFAMNNQLHILSEAVCSLPAYGMVLVQQPLVIPHTGWLYSATCSSDGKYVVTASAHGTAQIYDSTTQQVIGTIAHSERVTSATFSPDGRYVVTASWDNTTKIYNIATQQVIGTIGHDDNVISAVFSPDGKYIVTASCDKTAQIYDITTQQVIGTIHHDNWVISAVFSPDGKYVVTASHDNTAQIYDIETQKVILTIQHTNVVTSATFSHDGKQVVTASADGTAQIYDIAPQQFIGTIPHTGQVQSAVFSPEVRHVVTTSHDNIAQIYDIAAQQVIGTIAHNAWVTSATFSPDGRYVVTASLDTTAQIYDIAKKQVIGTIAHTGLVTSATFSPDGKYVVTASHDSTARITPLTLCGMPDMQVITIATLIDLAKQMETHEAIDPLVQTGWLYKEFKKLSDGEQQYLSSRFPHIKKLIDGAQDDQQQKQGKKQ